MCASLKHRLVVVSDVYDGDVSRLAMYSLDDGSLIRVVGSAGDGEGQFNLSCGGLCVCPDGDSVLVADRNNDRVQQLRIVDGSWVQHVGIGVLSQPDFVDCNADVIAVSETIIHRVTVLMWHDGGVVAQFGSEGCGPGQLNYPRGLRLMSDGSGLVVADSNNHRLCVFTLTGEFTRALGRFVLNVCCDATCQVAIPCRVRCLWKRCLSYDQLHCVCMCVYMLLCGIVLTEQ
jgi:hypothetical protein